MTKDVYVFSFVTSPLLFSFFHCSAAHFEAIIWRHTMFFFFLQELPLFLVSSTFPKKGGRLRFFVSYFCILSASHSRNLAGASLESLPKVWENRSWRNSFHASLNLVFWASRFALPVSECEICCDVLSLSLSFCRRSFILPHTRTPLILILSVSRSHTKIY